MTFRFLGHFTAWLAFDREDGSFYVTAVAETLWEAAYRVERRATSAGR